MTNITVVSILFIEAWGFRLSVLGVLGLGYLVSILFIEAWGFRRTTVWGDWVVAPEFQSSS